MNQTKTSTKIIMVTLVLALAAAMLLAGYYYGRDSVVVKRGSYLCDSQGQIEAGEQELDDDTQPADLSYSYDDWQDYSKWGVSLKLPKSWTAEVSPEDSNKISMKSADYTRDMATGELQGMWLELDKINDLGNFKDSFTRKALGENYKSSDLYGRLQYFIEKINGEDAYVTDFGIYRTGTSQLSKCFTGNDSYYCLSLNDYWIEGSMSDDDLMTYDKIIQSAEVK